MTKCGKCGYENPAGTNFCERCGHRIIPSELPPDDDSHVPERIQKLQQDLLARESDIKKLEEELKTVTLERDELAEKHPRIESILHQLDEKDRALQNALQQLDSLRERLPEPPAVTPGSKAKFLIESHPIANPALGTALNEDQESLDLSVTGFGIRATLERIAGGLVELVIHSGATLNVKAPGERKWRRVDGGERLNAEAGMILFDKQGAMNARLERSS